MNSILANITWPIRKHWYKIRLFTKCYKAFYAPWETIEMLQTMMFEVLVDFYENSYIEGISWESDEDHKHAKSEMDFLYNYWTKERKEKQEEMIYLLDVWSEHSISWWSSLNSTERFKTYNSTSSKYGEYIFKLLGETEDLFYKNEEEYLIRLVKIRKYMWT